MLVEGHLCSLSVEPPAVYARSVRSAVGSLWGCDRRYRVQLGGLEPGDEVRFGYKLLGRRLEGVAVLEEHKDAELTRFHTEVPGLPVMHFAYHYAEVDPEVFDLRVAMETEEPTSFFGRSIDRMLLPRVIERDLTGSLENLEDIFSAGLLD